MLKPFKYSLFIIIGVALAIGVVKVFYPLVTKRNELADARRAVVMDNEHLRKQISEYKQKQSDFQNDPEYIELVARRQGLVKRTEVIFDFSHLSGE
ncbi:MAG: septum formation initiator family protein [Kiritimatiellia bacterium]|jgi:uncharacterized membrane protein YccC